jgi:hypothetical protein
MTKPPKLKLALADVMTLALFAQRSPNAQLREPAFALALAALAEGAPDFAKLRPLCEFAARSKAQGDSAERAREVGERLLRENGRAELFAQLAGSAKAKG